MGKVNDLYIKKLESMSQKEREEYEIKEALKDQAVYKYLENTKKESKTWVKLF